jgi:phospholipid transport system substrate-binding protein
MRNFTKNYLAIVLSLTFFCLIPTINGYSDDGQRPQQIIQNISEQLQKKLQDKSFTQDFARVVQFVNGVIEPHTDFDKIAPLVLGKHWNTVTPIERERFKREFQTQLVRTYSRAFVEYSDWDIKYLPLEMAKDASKTIVKTKVLQRRIEPVEIYYRMFLSNGEWKVYDIVIDGVSLVTNYRSTFNEDILRKGSLTAVIEAMAKRNVEALAGNGR